MEESSMKPIPEYGDHMTLEEFVKSVKSGLFIDSDGHGYYANAKSMSPVVAIPSEIRRSGPLQGWTHVVWFNK